VRSCLNAMASFDQKEFEQGLALLSQELIARVEANADGVDHTPKAIAKRRKRVLNGDFKFFVYHYFSHHVWGEQSSFQKHVMTRLPKLLFSHDTHKEWWAAPRGESKSTVVSKISPVYVVVIGLLQNADIRKEIKWKGKPPPFIDYVMFLGAEEGLPLKFMNVVKVELEFNARLRMDFPEIVGRGGSWKVDTFKSINNILFEPLTPGGAGRGSFNHASRVKLFIPDDITTDKEARSLIMRNSRWAWLTDTVDYMGPPGGPVKLLGVNTFHNTDCPLSRADKSLDHLVHHFKAIEQLPTNMELWNECETVMRNKDKILQRDNPDKILQLEDTPSYQFYLANKEAMDAGAVTSWPSVRSLFELMKQRATKPASFKKEMQGEVRSDEDRVFTDIQFWISRLSHWIYFGACDPSMGKGESSDPSAILVGGWDQQSKKLHLIEAEVKRRVDSKLFSDLIKTQQEFNISAWAFENNNAYEFMRTQFMKMALEQKVVMSMIPYTNSVPPEVRIDSLEPHIVGTDPDILFHHKLVHLNEELDTWPEPQQHHHYDALNALHLLFNMAVTRAGGIPNIVSPNKRQDINWEGY